ncbi:MAG TPA: zinc ribbon domain-containing protein [Blastocatellia bacterium]|nr:zinc ribbon domain-containing protein [Blastocatellia bacterium]
MYCPKCSQQQVSEETRFCPRCGFQLDTIRTLLAGNQDILTVGEVEPRLTPARKRDILLEATVMLAGSILIALLAISTVAPTPLPAIIIPLLLLWIGLVAALLLSGHAVREVSKLFSKNASAALPKTSDLITQVSVPAHNKALPPIQSTPVPGLGSWRSNTAELAEPASITEHTTDSLNKK